MGLQLQQVVPWGRSQSEYIQMFGLAEADLERSILDCAAGPASFNAEMTQQGRRVVSCDPIYQFATADIEQRIRETYSTIVDGVRQHQDAYVWREIRSPEHLGQVRMAAMQQFLQDFPQGVADGRYVVAELPMLPFGDRQFDLALCSHFLFTYSNHFSQEFHVDSVRELCRVAAEVRIFPLLTTAGERSPVLPGVQEQLSQQGYQVQVQTVPYEFQNGGNEMLSVIPRQHQA